MSDSRIRQQSASTQNQGGTAGSYQVPETYDPAKLGEGELVRLITLGEGAEISAGNRETFAYELTILGLKGWYKGEVVFDLNNQGLSLTGDVNARSGTFSGEISIGDGDSIFRATEEGIYLGSEFFDRAPFRVSPEGDLFASSVTLTGELLGTLRTANAGRHIEIGPDIESGFSAIAFHPTSGVAPAYILGGLDIGSEQGISVIVPFNIDGYGLGTEMALTAGSVIMTTNADYLPDAGGFDVRNVHHVLLSESDGFKVIVDANFGGGPHSIHVSKLGKLAFHGAVGLTRDNAALGAAAVTAAETTTLVNTIRTVLKNYGLC